MNQPNKKQPSKKKDRAIKLSPQPAKEAEKFFDKLKKIHKEKFGN